MSNGYVHVDVGCITKTKDSLWSKIVIIGVCTCPYVQFLTLIDKVGTDISASPAQINNTNDGLKTSKAEK